MRTVFGLMLLGVVTLVAGGGGRTGDSDRATRRPIVPTLWGQCKRSDRPLAPGNRGFLPKNKRSGALSRRA